VVCGCLQALGTLVAKGGFLLRASTCVHALVQLWAVARIGRQSTLALTYQWRNHPARQQIG